MAAFTSRMSSESSAGVATLLAAGMAVMAIPYDGSTRGMKT